MLHLIIFLICKMWKRGCRVFESGDHSSQNDYNEPSRAEPSRAEPSRAEPSRAEPSRAEPSRAEPSRAEPSRAEPSRAEPSRAEPMTAPCARRGASSRPEAQSFLAAPTGLRLPDTPNPDSDSVGERAGGRRRLLHSVAARTLRAVAGLSLFFLALLGIQGVAHAQTDIFSETLTVGATTTNPALFGFVPGNPTMGSLGTLDDRSIPELKDSRDTQRRTINGLTTENGTLEINFSQVTLLHVPEPMRFDPLDRAGFRARVTLYIGTTAFAFADATWNSNGSTLTWTNSGLTWAASETYTVRITLDDPTVTLHLTANSIDENGGSSTVTATLNDPSDENTTVTVSAVAVSPAVAADFRLSSNNTLTIAAGSTTSTGRVTITAVNNSVDAPDKEVTVSVSVANTDGVTAPADMTLTIEDDEGEPTARLILTPNSINEDGGSSTVTAQLSHASSEETTLTVSAAAGEDTVSGDFTLSATTTLTIAAGSTTSTGTVTIGAVNNDADELNKRVTVSASAANTQGVTAPADVTLTIVDDEGEEPIVSLLRSSTSMSENGGRITMRATINQVSTVDTLLMVSVEALSPAVEADFTLSSITTLTILAGSLSTPFSGPNLVRISAVDNSVDAPDKTIIVSASVVNTAQRVIGPAPVSLTIYDDDDAPTVRLNLSASSVEENLGSSIIVPTLSHVTATLSHASSEATSITVSADAVSPAVAGDFTLSDNTTLTIAAGATTSTGTVAIDPVDNSMDAPNKSITVSAVASNTQGVNAPADVTLTIKDDERTPSVELYLSHYSIFEGGGDFGRTPVLARLSHPSSAETTLTVSAAAGTSTVDGDFTLSSSTALTIAAGATTSTGTVTIVAVNNSADGPNKEVTVSASAANSQGVNAPTEVTLTIVDDEGTPTVLLRLSDDSISEDGESTTVTALISHFSSAETTVTVSAVAVSPAVAGDFTLSSDKTLTIPANSRSSAGTVTITAVNNSIYTSSAPNKQVTVSASATNTQGVNSPANVTLTIEDDEGVPTATFLLFDSTTISENGGTLRMAARLSHPVDDENINIFVLHDVNSPDFELVGDAALIILAGNVVSDTTELVTIRAIDNDVDAPDKEVTVYATAVSPPNAGSDYQVFNVPAPLTVTILDDEEAPTATLTLTPDSIDENGGSSTVTAEISHPSSARTTLNVSAAAGANAAGGDFELSANTTLTIAPGATLSTETVTVRAVNNTEDGPESKEVTVSASAVNTQGVTEPADVTLTITDDDGEPAVTLVLTPDSINESSGSSTVTAVLSHTSRQETTLTVSAAAGANAVDGDFELSANKTLRIAAGATRSTGMVTIGAVNNDVDGPDKEVTVSAVAANSAGVTEPADVTLIITDDEAEPTVTLILTPDSIGENGGSSTLTATLSHASVQETTLTVSAVAGANAADGDFTLSSNTTLRIAAGVTTSTGTVTIGAVNNDADGPNKEVTVSASAINTQGVSAPAEVTLIIIDDEGSPTVTLILIPDSIGEDGGSSTVTATLSHVSSVETTLTVQARPVSPAVAADFELSGNTTLRIAAGNTTSTGTVTIDAVNNDVDAQDKQVTVSASVVNTQGVNAPAGVMLTIEDDEELVVTLILTPDSIEEDGGSSTVTATLSHMSSAFITIRVSVSPVSPAVAGDFTLSSNSILSINPGNTSSSQSLTITAVNNGVDAPDKMVTVSGSIVRGPDIADATLTIEDDEDPPTVRLILTPDSIGENDASSTVTAELSHVSSEETTVMVSAAAGANAVDGDFVLSANTTLTIDAGDTTSVGTVTIRAVNNSVDGPDKEVAVSANASNTQGVTGPAELTLAIEDDEEAPTATLVLTPDSIDEDGGPSTVTAELSHVSSAETVLTVSAVAGANAADGDFELSADNTLRIAAGNTTSTGTVTIEAVNNSADGPDKEVTVSASASNAQGVTAPAEVTLTIEDDEETPTVTLILMADSIDEDGGSTAVRATLSHPSSYMTLVLMSATAVHPTREADFELSNNRYLTIAPGDTQSTGTVTISAVNNDVDEPDKEVTVSASASNSQVMTTPADVTLTITDDEETPTATLILSVDPVSENSGSSTVTAELSHASSEETTLMVSATAVFPAVASDFELSANATLTIAAGNTTSDGTVTIEAVNNDVDAPNKSFTVSASASNTQGVTAPANVTLTIEDDDEAPTAMLILTPDPIGENGGSSAVTAELSHASSEATTLTVSAAAGANTADGDFSLSADTTLTIAAGDTTSAGTVTIEAVNNDVDAPDKEVTVSASAINTQGVTAPAELTLTIEDDEEAPTAVLHLSSPSISENLGSSTVTATLSHASSEETTLTVSAAAGANTADGDFSLSDDTTLTIAAGDTTSTGTVTIAAVDNALDDPNKQVTVSASASNIQGVTMPAAVTLTIEDNEGEPTARLILTTDSIGENGGSTTVTAQLSDVSSAETVLTVSVAAVLPAVAADFTLSSNTTLRIAAGATSSTGMVTITAVNNSVDAPDKTFTVSASASNTVGVTAPANVTLTIEDDEEAPTATLTLTPDSISENVGLSAVTATLSHASSEETTLTVSATAVSPAVAADFTLSATTTLTIAAGNTMSTGTVTIASVNNSVDAPDKTLTVSASAANTQGVSLPAGVTLTITDDEEAPTATLILTPDLISENVGSSTVTATLSHASSEETTLTVSAAAGANAADGDFNLSATTTLTIAAGNTMSTGTVTITAVNNDADDPNKEVTVSASATNSQGVTDPANVTLTIEDDEGEATARLILTPDSISENGASSTVTAELSHVSSALTTLTVSVAAVSPAVAADFTLSSNTTLTIAAGATTSTEMVTIAAVNNSVDAPDKLLTVSASATNMQGVTAPVEVILTLEDDDETPTATLILLPDSISENLGSSTVTAELSHPSSAETRLTVSAAAGVNAANRDFALSGNTILTIAAGATMSTETVTIRAVNNSVDAPDKEVTVSASATNSQGVTAPANLTLTIEDDEEAPTATLILAPDSISENGGSSTVRATLSHASSAETTLTVSATAGANTADGDFELSVNTTLTIAPGMTASTGRVTIRAVNNSADGPNKEVTVSASATNSLGVTDPANVTLTLEDDEETPTVTLILTPDSISENGGSSTVTAMLSHVSSITTMITVSAAPGANAAGGDFTLNGTELMIATGGKTSTGTVTISAFNNSADEPNKEVTVSASATNSQGVTDPANVTLTIEDDEETPTVTLILTLGSIDETMGSSTVTATLSNTSSAETTIMVSAAAGANAADGDFTLSADTTLTIAAGDTTSSGIVTIRAVDNRVDAPDKEVTVSADATNTVGVNAPAEVTLTIEDDEEAPTATLILTPDSISESGSSNTSTVTAELSHPSSAATTIAVSATAGIETADADFTLSASPTLTINPGDTTSTGTVTIGAVNNDVDEFNKRVTVSASAANAQGVNGPADVTLTIEDDEEAPTATLHLSPSSISEDGGSSTVTATLSHASSFDTAIFVLQGVVSPDFELDSNFVLVIFAGVTMSTETVTINAIDNDVDAPDKEVTVSATVTNGVGVNAPADVTLTIEDDEESPTATLILTPDSIDEDGESSTVTATLSHASSETTTITVAAVAVSPAIASDFELSADTTLTIAAGLTSSTGTVTIEAVSNEADNPDRTVTVSASAVNTQGVTGPSDVTLTLEDNEEAPTATLILTPDSIDEDGGSSTVTATLSHASSETTTITVAAVAVSPAMASDFELSADTTLTIAAGLTSSTGTVTIEAVSNEADTPDRTVTVSASAVNTQGVTGPSDVTLTLEDNEEAPTATLILTPVSIGENGGSSAVTAELSHPSSEETTLTVSTTAGADTADEDFALSADTTLTIAAGATTSTGIVTIRAVDNRVDAPDKEVTVTASAVNTQGVTVPADVTLTIEDDEATPTATLNLEPNSIDENGGVSSAVTAELSHPSIEETTLTVSTTAGADTADGDFTLSADTTLTIAAGATSSTGTVTIGAVDNTADEPNKEVTVSASAANTQGVTAPDDVKLTIIDDEGEPTVTLILAPDSISESGASNTSTVSASLSHMSSARTTITVSAAAVSPAVSADFTLSTNKTLTINAGAMSSTETVTIGAVNNGVDAPDKEVTVSASAANMQGVTSPVGVTLTITDDEETPTVTLILSPDSISESGDSSTTTVSATLSHASSEATAITVTATSDSPSDFALSANTTLTIAAGDTTSTGTTVTIAAVNDRADAPDKEVTVSASAVNTQGVIAPANVTLTIEDDEGEPRMTLILTPASIDENGASSTVSASMFPVSSAETTITVSAAAGANATDGDYELSANTTLTIAANSATAFGTVTITAVNNSEDGPNKEVTVSASVVNSQGVKAPADRTLTIEDDEETPAVTLVLASDSISEDGGSSTVTATLSHASSEATRLTVSASPGFNTFSRNFALSSNKILTIAAGDTTSTGMVTIEAVNNGVHTRDKKVQVKAIAFNPQGVNAPADLTLTIEDDEEAPTVTLILTPDSISENGGSSTMTATLSHTSSATTTITVLAEAGANAVDGDFTLSANKTLTINAGDTSSTGTVVMIETVDNNVDAPDKEVTVSASATNLLGVNAPANMTLIIEDDEDAPIAELILTPDSIGENGQSSTVTAMLSHASSEATTITVAATAVLPALAADFDLSANTTLTIDAGDTTSTGTVTIAAVNNSVDAPDKQVTVSASATNLLGVTAPANVTLTIEDDEEAPTAELHLSLLSIGENGGSTAVRATLSHASSEVTTITVSAAAGANAADGDFSLSANPTLTIAAGDTTSTGTVTIDAVNNDANQPNKEVTVSANAVNTQGVTGPEDVTLTLLDDEGNPSVVLHLSLLSIGENGGSSTVTATLSHVSSATTTITVLAAAGANAADEDFSLSANPILTIDAGETMSTGTVTITAVNNGIDAPDKSVTVSAASVLNSRGVEAPGNLTLTIEDDEAEPTVTLILTPDSINEDSGSSTVTAELSHASSEETTLTVSAAAGANAADGDFTLSANTTLTIAAGDTTSTGAVTIEAVNNGVDAPDKQVTVSASAVNTQGVNAPANLTLTIEDDEAEPTVTLILTPDSIGEDGGSSTVTAELSHTSSEQTTLTVSASAGANTVPEDFILSANPTLTIAAGATTSTGTVTIEAVNNGVDGPDKSLTVSATAANSEGVNAPADLTLTIEDDEEVPTAMLILTPDSIGENGGLSTVTAELSHTSSEETTLTVSAAAVSPAVAADFDLSTNITLTIAADATTSTGTVTITAVDNDVDEDDKSLTVSASVVNSAGVIVPPADLMLTIVEDEGRLLPEVTLAVKALLTRIGRTAAAHVVDAVGTRLFGTKNASHVTLAGQRLPFSDAPLPQANTFVGKGPWDARPLNHEWNQISGEQEDLQGTSVRSITSREMLAGSSFSLRLAEDDDESRNTGKWTAWGLTAQSDIDGRDGDLLLNGDVTTVIMGVDAELRQTMTGVALAHSSGDSAFEVDGSCDDPRCKGTLNTQLTGVYPYLHHDVNERVSISGVLGYAKGDLAYSGDNSVVGIESRTAAFSTRGTLQPVPSENGVELAVRLDAFLNWVRTEETANLEAIETDTSRLRLALEASRTLALDSDRALTSTLQLGVRHDGGDAEIGHGVDIKAALRYADPARGLSVEGAIHRLISHEDADYEEQGVSASVRLSPDAAGLGLSLSLASSWSAGATTRTTTNPWSILNAETSSDNSNFNSATRLDAELGYGLPAFGNQSVHTPYFGFSLSDGGDTTERFGWRLRTGSDFTLKLEAARHHQSDGETPQNSIELQAAIRW